jgi:hypothetical protein
MHWVHTAGGKAYRIEPRKLPDLKRVGDARGVAEVDWQLFHLQTKPPPVHGCGV